MRSVELPDHCQKGSLLLPFILALGPIESEHGGYPNGADLLLRVVQAGSIGLTKTEGREPNACPEVSAQTSYQSIFGIRVIGSADSNTFNIEEREERIKNSMDKLCLLHQQHFIAEGITSCRSASMWGLVPSRFRGSYGRNCHSECRRTCLLPAACLPVGRVGRVGRESQESNQDTHLWIDFHRKLRYIFTLKFVKLTVFRSTSMKD